MTIDQQKYEKVEWVANQIFQIFPDEVPGLKFYLLDCGCVYYQRVFEDDSLDDQIGIFRDMEDGPCEKCMLQKATWKDRVFDRVSIYRSHFGFGIEP